MTVHMLHKELKPAAPGPGLDSPLARHSVPSVAVCTAFFATKGSWTSSEPQLRRSAVCCVSWDFYSFLVCQRVVTGWSRWWIPKSKWTKVNVSKRQWTKGNVFVILILYEYLYDLSKFFGPRFCPILMLLRKWGPETPETFWKSVSWPRLWSHVVPFATIKCQLFDVFVSAPEPLRFLLQQWFWTDSKSSLRWSIRWPCTLVVWSRKMPARLDGGELTPVEILPIILR
jgi:hypothetical protein